MHLVSCIRPAGPLEPAPATSLRAAGPGEQWDGFWCVTDERFYTRCVSAAAETRWYRIADESDLPDTRRLSTRVIPLRGRGGRSPRMIVGRYRGQAMLVGTRRRRQPVGER